MSNGPQTPRPTMEGRGVYNANSALQASGAALALPVFEKAASEVATSGDRPIVIADYGASEGRNSQPPMRIAIAALRRRFGDRRAICVVHTDLPTNDFSMLFTTLEEAPDSYARGELNVFPSAVGRSFYEAVVPSDHVDLAWNSYAAQWLSKLPGLVPDHIIGFRSSGSLRQAFVRQGKDDWEKFLSLRAAELRSGGRLVVCVPSLEDDGSHPLARLFDTANVALAEMVNEGVIDADERAGMCVAAYPRTPAEMLAPFENSGGRIPWRMISSSFPSFDDRNWTTYCQDGDVAKLAARRAGFFRATFGPSLASALNVERERKAFAERLEAGMRHRLIDVLAPIPNRVAILSLVRA